MVRDPAYDLKPVDSPRLRGLALRLVVALLERPRIAAFLAPLLAKGLGLAEFRATAIDEPPTFLPLHSRLAFQASPNTPGDEVRCQDPLATAPAPAPPHPGHFRFRRIRDFQQAYLEKAVTPELVAERALAAVAAADAGPTPVRAFISLDRDLVLAQARDSTLRYSRGQPLGPLDGIPIAVKDELDMVPFPTTGGTSFLRTPAQTDATVVARLRNAGALLLGKTNMHEIGILPDARNAHYGAVRNPCHPAREAGGSSSGSAAAVAAGLCPAALGADGGGSIRIPAAFCGLVGLKPTYGRVSEFGALPLAWSVAHLGPIAVTAEDAALIYAAVAGPDPFDPNTLAQPPLQIPQPGASIHGIRIGVYRDWFCDADPEVVAACDSLLQRFAAMGAELVEIVVPGLRLIAVAHGLTIHTEMAANMSRYDSRHRRDFTLTTRLMLAHVRTMRSSDYVQAQRIRTRAIDSFLSALRACDVIATPAAPSAAPEISRHALLDRESDIGRVVRTMRFVNPANLTGLPAITIPAGYDSLGLPIGLQLIGRPWDEKTLFRLAFAADAGISRRRPQVYFDLLSGIDLQ